MKADNQHLDFLISQYVDGCLEGANKKSVEQQMLNDPAGRALYGEHQEVQDLLDDWGSRIPLIDWADFDKKLDVRLEKEVQEKERGSIFRRRLRPFAAAAALLLAAGIGYGWHAMSSGRGSGGTGMGSADTVAAIPVRGVQFPEMTPQNLPSRHGLAIIEPAARGLSGGNVEGLAIAPPQDSEAVQSLIDTVAMGMRNEVVGGSSSGGQGTQPDGVPQMDEREYR